MDEAPVACPKGECGCGAAAGMPRKAAVTDVLDLWCNDRCSYWRVGTPPVDVMQAGEEMGKYSVQSVELARIGFRGRE